MKQAKNYLWSLLIILPIMFSMSGCKKFLDRKPLGRATEGDLSQGGVEGKVFGLYGSLITVSGMTDFPMLWFKSIRSDDASKGSIPGDLADGGQAMDDFEYSKDHWLLNSNWDGHYTFINAANDVIHDVDSLGLTDPGSLVNRAEAQFFRAYAYFDLVRDYGEVPIIDFKIYEPGDLNKAKSSVAAVYAFIENDLNTAAAVLPTSWSAQFPGRVTKGTANSLLSKVLIYQEKWGPALAKAEEVINSGQYALVPSYVEYFKEGGENSSESILEAQMYVNNNGTVTEGNNHFQVQGIRGSGDWDLGWGFNVPTLALHNSYEAGDPRREATILYEGQADGIYGRTIPTGLAQPRWNKKAYPDPVRRNAITDRSKEGQFSRWMNVRLLRFADILLIAAEAANELGGASNVDKALDYLERVRARARGGAAVLPEVTTTDQAQLRDAIRRERRAEFGMEYERFYDLVRWKDANGKSLAETVLEPLGYEPRNKYYPVPQPVLDRFSEIKQNPDYP